MSAARELLRINPLPSLRHGSKLVVYRKVTFRVARSAELSIGEKFTLGRQWAGGAPLYPGHFVVRDGAQVHVAGRGSFMSGLRVGVASGAVLRIGHGSGSNVDIRLSCYRSITIGDNVIIGDRVTFRDSDNHDMDGKPQSAPIVVEDDVWIGFGATIMKGVTIGRGAVVAAHSVVTRDVPPGTLVAGVPAVVKRKDVSWGL
ncbi:transferase hexapeptide (six repeat-containing protein) [Geodermatophilus telluris]|uniref:Transferase hexapeptide (Six repeat-containing protein) n=1 Tax=Geodermatophilus telluris TaxID=1190417 RepID=A0A1G6LAG1_9ACTN|nr:acyltransferase [Geodermatophilus telluris]SDC39556.1 transferase hexapeptide (six repeat-containing protein) [Geodermatophilus telluris]